MDTAPLKQFVAASLLCLAAYVAAGEPASCGEPPVPNASKSPAIQLRAELSDQSSAAFARKVGELLGLEVRLPLKRYRKLTVPAGEWTAVNLLNHIARENGGLSWKHVFELRAQVKGGVAKAPAEAKLPVTGNVTFRAEAWTYPRVVESVQQSGACLIRLPDGIPPGRFRIAWNDTPLQQVLAGLARAGGLRVHRVVVFQTPEDAQEEARKDQDAQASREALQQGEVANRLQELYGVDAYSEDFPWETIDGAGVAASLGRELDLDPAFVETLWARIRLDGLARVTVPLNAPG